MKISIIAVGSELLLGQIANTNGQFLSKLFNEIGKDVVEHTVIGDNPHRLEHVIRSGLERFDTLILTGGLGPTKDDLTKHTVAKVLNKELITDEPSLDYIESYFREQGQEMTPNNKQQALVIKDSIVLPNHHGMAPGMLIETGNKKIVMLPGPPKEMQPMAKHELLPYFMDNKRIIHSELLRFAGIGESKVETVLMDMIDHQTNPTIAPLAGSHEVYIRLTASAESKTEAENIITPIKKEILERIGEFYYGSDDILLEQAVIQRINTPFAIYDGVTNGALFNRLKNVDEHEMAKGSIIDSEYIINKNNSIEEQLLESTNYTASLYQVPLAISILNQDNTIYLALLENDKLTIESFKMAQSRNLMHSRSQNYALIRLLNSFK
ncbi:CinA family nicotinamide mononucleotide deamidase-related protein [Staphylococcus simiae]|uniref:CinA family nicotinamide mononucleotide deamidase-related protein n=1 Tax=Staphylococcus simiae TaxID=308354 RepID=UPI001A959FC9|nr:CinA family nicotinamide mononucleotide deamidase-related protein [Staphylococcus simiae]MBO1198967.1 CinA family nicotinamide mononucleotide deamidase-related protein [Staphylococcus simiae]MBO1201234.1 CinA family nicotinamide mononucleotide deamidase-related protein [Staphylococcus simiae]MBO1203383.1 CinA family nicotinamide mononucleotide deamidase-related protein [Staphylococcus simiae]MBO1210951.1 CinA family nicotinamide mononucleotide deamidase-related protein [Staphylococcus simiae